MILEYCHCGLVPTITHHEWVNTKLKQINTKLQFISQNDKFCNFLISDSDYIKKRDILKNSEILLRANLLDTERF